MTDILYRQPPSSIQWLGIVTDELPQVALPKFPRNQINFMCIAYSRHVFSFSRSGQTCFWEQLDQVSSKSEILDVH
ncbi:hypothetical protein Mapa_013439 [Marchantia paleacea]|nr:hypothetical protein Mapa_013439 [Marchantia paleacea]